jgi:hypothetical protein
MTDIADDLYRYLPVIFKPKTYTLQVALVPMVPWLSCLTCGRELQLLYILIPRKYDNRDNNQTAASQNKEGVGYTPLNQKNLKDTNIINSP